MGTSSSARDTLKKMSQKLAIQVALQIEQLLNPPVSLSGPTKQITAPLCSISDMMLHDYGGDILCGHFNILTPKDLQTAPNILLLLTRLYSCHES